MKFRDEEGGESRSFLDPDANVDVEGHVVFEAPSRVEFFQDPWRMSVLGSRASALPPTKETF